LSDNKIVFTGTMGAGKTTAIAAISEITPIVTDVKNTDPTLAKARTTVGFDYGELTLENAEKIRLYGTPGQARFAFMWRIIAKGALGLIVLIDNSRPDPVGDFETYLDGFSELIGADLPLVVGIGRSDTYATPALDEFSDVLASRSIIAPVLPVDVRKREDVLLLVNLLLTQLENQV
jgi:uncharacterized protein